MLVYRIEDHKGIGPWLTNLASEYHCKFSEKFFSDANVKTHPAPPLDKIQGFDPFLHRCACESIEQLKYWFGRNTLPEFLNEWGFIIRVYKIDEDKVKIGDHQVVYDPDYAMLKEEHNIIEALS